MEQKNKDNVKIITKKAKSLRGLIYNGLGGISIFDLFVFSLIMIIGVLVMVLIGNKHIFISLGVLILFIVLGIFLITSVGGQDKLYKYIIRALLFMFSGKKINNGRLLAYKKIIKTDENILHLYKNQKALIYEVKSININLMNQEERNKPIKRLYDVFKNITIPMELIKVQVPYDLEKHHIHIKNLYENLDVENLNQNEIKQIQNIWDTQKEIDSNNIYTKTKWFMIFYGSNISQIEDEIKFNITLYNNDLSFEKANNKDVLEIIKSNSLQLDFKRKESIKIKKNYLVINNKEYVAYRKIANFSQFVSDKWMFNLGNLKNIDVNIKINYLSEYEAIKKLDKATMRAQMDNSKKASEQINVNNYYDNFLTLLDMVKTSQESLKMIDIIFKIKGNSLTELKEQDNFLKNQIFKNNFTMNKCNYDQFKIFENQLTILSKKIIDNQQEISVDALSSCWPFIPNPLDDDKGQLMGFNEYNEPIFFDAKLRDSKRVSSNILVFGKTGGGKTYNVSKQLNYLYLNNTKLFIIDPEAQFHQLANYYGGEIIPIGKNNKFCINPLEIFNTNKDLMEHISFLEQFFKILYPDLNDFHFADFQKILLATYQSKNIDINTCFSNLKSKNYPVLNDLYKVVSSQFKGNSLEQIIWKLSKGADGYLWNQHSNINLIDKKLVVFDIHSLNTNENIKNAQLFIMLQFLNNEIKENKAKNLKLPKEKQQWICLAIDEAHLLINKENEHCLNFLVNMAKQIRKYNGILYLISQNIGDFVGRSKVLEKSKKIVNNCGYHFIHGLESSDINDYANLIKDGGGLNNYEKNSIATFTQGECLFIFNNINRNTIKIESFAIEDEAWM